MATFGRFRIEGLLVELKGIRLVRTLSHNDVQSDGIQRTAGTFPWV